MDEFQNGCARVIYRAVAMVAAMAYLAIAALGLWVGLYLPTVTIILLFLAGFLGVWYAGLKAFKGEPASAEPNALEGAVLNILFLVANVIWFSSDGGDPGYWELPKWAWIGQNLIVCGLGILLPMFKND